MTKLKQWTKATQELADYFVKKNFGKDASEVFWIADNIGEVLAVNDYFFSLQDIVDFLKYKYTPDEMFDYYDYRLKIDTEGKTTPTNIKNWRQLK